MKAKIISFAVALLASSLFAENYLYWMVDITGQEEYQFLYARVLQDGALLYNNAYSGGEIGADVINSDGTEATGYLGVKTAETYAYGITDNYIGSTFLFELFDSSDALVAWRLVSGADLAHSIGGTMSSGTSLYTVSNVIPEPSSALLFLLGITALALRRRQASMV